MTHLRTRRSPHLDGTASFLAFLYPYPVNRGMEGAWFVETLAGDSSASPLRPLVTKICRHHDDWKGSGTTDLQAQGGRAPSLGECFTIPQVRYCDSIVIQQVHHMHYVDLPETAEPTHVSVTPFARLIFWEGKHPNRRNVTALSEENFETLKRVLLESGDLHEDLHSVVEWLLQVFKDPDMSRKLDLMTLYEQWHVLENRESSVLGELLQVRAIEEQFRRWHEYIDFKMKERAKPPVSSDWRPDWQWSGQDEWTAWQTEPGRGESWHQGSWSAPSSGGGEGTSTARQEEPGREESGHQGYWSASSSGWGEGAWTAWQEEPGRGESWRQGPWSASSSGWGEGTSTAWQEESGRGESWRQGRWRAPSPHGHGAS